MWRTLSLHMSDNVISSVCVLSRSLDMESAMAQASKMNTFLQGVASKVQKCASNPTMVIFPSSMKTIPFTVPPSPHSPAGGSRGKGDPQHPARSPCPTDQESSWNGSTPSSPGPQVSGATGAECLPPSSDTRGKPWL